MAGIWIQFAQSFGYGNFEGAICVEVSIVQQRKWV
jgi:hypothetical protein